MSTITVTLSAVCMGDVDETDFDLWAEFVRERIGQAMGFDVTVEQSGFGEPDGDMVTFGPETDPIEEDDRRAAILRWLSHEGWNAFCGREWTMRRRAVRERIEAEQGAGS